MNTEHLSRSEQRRQRLLEIEHEQEAEEAEALRMTEDQRKMLVQSFASVKVEFCDLDGQTWTQAALRLLQPHQWRQSNTFVVHATVKSPKRPPPLQPQPSQSPPPRHRPFTRTHHCTNLSRRLRLHSVLGIQPDPVAHMGPLPPTPTPTPTAPHQTPPTPTPTAPSTPKSPRKFTPLDLTNDDSDSGDETQVWSYYPIKPLPTTYFLGDEDGDSDDDSSDRDDFDDQTPMPSPTISRCPMPFRAPVL